MLVQVYLWIVPLMILLVNMINGVKKGCVRHFFTLEHATFLWVLYECGMSIQILKQNWYIHGSKIMLSCHQSSK